MQICQSLRVYFKISLYNIHFDYKEIQFIKIQLKNHKSILEQFDIFEKRINEDFKFHRIYIINLLSKIYYISFLDLISKIINEIIMIYRYLLIIQ